jgi:hypothetical protein
VAFRNNTSGFGQAVIVSPVGMVSDVITFNSASTANISLTTTYDDAVVVAYEDRGNNNYGALIKLDYQGILSRARRCLMPRLLPPSL